MWNNLLNQERSARRASAYPWTVISEAYVCECVCVMKAYVCECVSYEIMSDEGHWVYLSMQ